MEFSIQKRTPPMYLTFYLSIFFPCHFFVVRCASLWFISSHSSLSPSFEEHPEVSSSSPWTQMGMNACTFFPSAVSVRKTTHYYCHSLFQSCCYILKTLRAGVVLIPDYSPAQCIKQGQMPFNPGHIALFTTCIISHACETDLSCLLTWV